MRTYDLTDQQGRVFAFEIDNVWMDRASVAAVVRTIPGARLKELHVSWFGPDEFCEFEVGGITFVAWEPYGDNSRYWIGPRPPEFSEHTATIRAAFASHVPRSSNLLQTAVWFFAVGFGTAVFSRQLGLSVLTARTALAVAVFGLVLGVVAICLRLRGLRAPVQGGES